MENLPVKTTLAAFKKYGEKYAKSTPFSPFYGVKPA